MNESDIRAQITAPDAAPPDGADAPVPPANQEPSAPGPGAAAAAVSPVEANPAAEEPRVPDDPAAVADAPVAEAAAAPAEPPEPDWIAEAIRPVEANPVAETETVAQPVEPGDKSARGQVPQPATAEPDASAVAEDAAELSPIEANPAAEPDENTDPSRGTVADVPAEAAPSAAPAVAAKLPLTEEQKAANAARAEERRARAEQAWERVVNAHANAETLPGNVTVAVKGGLLVDIGGIRGFLPASQVRVPLGTGIETLVRTKVPLKVIDVDTSRRRVVVSHRRAADDERRTKRAELLRSLEVGQTREGVVVRLADFGAFVDLGGIDGLIPMRELAFERVEKVQDVLKVGDRLPVEVLRIEENGKKISLSRKNALPDPWRDHADVLRRDTTLEGKVVGKDVRLQVEIAPGVIGVVRESDADPADYELGEAIEVIVRSVDRRTRRIILSTTHGVAAAPQPSSSSTGSGFAPLGVELRRLP